MELMSYKSAPWMFHLKGEVPVNPTEKFDTTWDYYSAIRYEPSYYQFPREMGSVVEPQTELTKYKAAEINMIYIGFATLALYIYLSK